VQSFSSAPHAVWQVPPMQVWLALHVVPHAPQFDSEVARTTQAPLQLVWPGGHVAVQAPFTQV
jgi:hypothetical protein